jgi:hypothetical protein
MHFGLKHPHSNIVRGIEQATDLIGLAVSQEALGVSDPAAIRDIAMDTLVRIVGNLIEEVGQGDPQKMAELCGLDFYDVVRHPHDG